VIPKVAPPHIKAILKKTFAIERLRRAAQALLDENTEVAQSSYQEPGVPWTDAMWREGDAENARLCIELRRALKGLASEDPKRSREKVCDNCDGRGAIVNDAGTASFDCPKCGATGKVKTKP
jgi:DnaJ-class molecular chaperone